MDQIENFFCTSQNYHVTIVYLREEGAKWYCVLSCDNAVKRTPKMSVLIRDKNSKDLLYYEGIFFLLLALWNSFPLHVRNSPSVASFRKHLKTLSLSM